MYVCMYVCMCAFSLSLSFSQISADEDLINKQRNKDNTVSLPSL